MRSTGVQRLRNGNFFLTPTVDIVFFIFLYQRWIYRVDPKRVNEFGTTGEDTMGPPGVTQGSSGEETSGDPPITTNGTDPVVKDQEEKKND